MNADLHVANELRNTGKGNLFDILDASNGKLTERLAATGAVPERIVLDASHFAIAAANEVEYLVTWIFRQIANAMMRLQIESVCRKAGVAPRYLQPRRADVGFRR